jgi:hypothetical protein
LAKISQKCVSCSNCPPKCVERSYYLTDIVASSPTICKDSFANCSLCFPVLCWSTFVQNAHRRQTFVCPWSVCTIKGFALAHGISPKASRSIRRVSAAGF